MDPQTPSSNSSVDPSFLETAVAHLQRNGDVQGVVRVVERWSRLGEPSDQALLDQARAFLSVNLMDRAWVRLKEVGERSPELRECHLLTAQMFIERGWPLRARKLLEKLPERDDLSESLMVRAQQPALQPPKDARRIEVEGTPEEKLALAERWMAAGTFLRAKSVLERLHRAGGPATARAELLLWGLAGSFVNEGGDPMDLVRTRAPELFSVDEANTLSQTLDEEEGYGGEVTSAGLATEDAGGSDEGFPALFRRAEAGPLGPISDEVTAVSKLASPGELAHRDPTEDTDHGDGGPLISGDTQIMMVIRKDGQAEDDGEHHVLKDEDDALRETLNLRDYLSHMGVDPALSDLGKSDLDLDEDDEDLIVVTKREAPAIVEREHTEELMLDEPVQVVERPLTPIHPPDDEVSASERTIGEPPPPLRPRAGDSAPESGGDEESSSLGKIFLLLVLGLSFLVAIAIAGWLLSQRMARNAVMDGALDAVAAQEIQGLQELEAQLAVGLEQNPKDATLNASFALVELVLWQEYTGDVSRLEQANQAAATAALAGGEGRSVALVYAYKALAQGDLESAEANLEAVRETPEGEHLRSGLAQGRGELERAREHAQAALELSPGSPRYALRVAEVCQAQGDTRCVDESLAQAAQGGDIPEVELMMLRRSVTSDAPSAQLKVADRFVATPGLHARISSQAQLWRAELLARSGKGEAAAIAIQEGLSLDPDNPDLLVYLAALQASEGMHRAALASLERASTSRPMDLRVQGARLQILVELDRVEQAERLLQQLPSDPRRDSLEGLVDLFGHGDAEHAKELAQRRLKLGEDPLASFVLGFALGRLGQDRASELLAEAHTALRDSKDPFHNRLASRALAAQALFDQDLDLGRQALRGGDPLAIILVAQLYAKSGSEEALTLYDRATELGPEVSLAHYARGKFHAERAGGTAVTRESWRAYLALSPSGERAEEVRDVLASR